MKRTISLAVEVANDDEYAAVIQRAQALHHVIDIRYTWNRGQEGLADLVRTGPLGFDTKWSKVSDAEFIEEVADEGEATDADQALADTVVEMILGGALDPQFQRIVDAVEDRFKREADEQKAAQPKDAE